jgi:hypothetical protein
VATIEIGRLRLRGPPAMAGRAAFRIEDACRTAIGDSERLVLVRRLMLGREASGQRPAARSAAVRRAFGEATARSRHGGDSGAAAANCVWFASRGEARTLLLRALLSGHGIDAWYWRRAVPEWGGRSLAAWLGLLVREALRDGAEIDLVEIVRLAMDEDAEEPLWKALTTAAGGSSEEPVQAGGDSPAATPLRAFGPQRRDLPDEDRAVRETVAKLRQRMPARLREQIELIVMQSGLRAGIVERLLARLLILVSPPLALSPPLLRMLAAAYREAVAAPSTIVAPPLPMPRGGGDRTSSLIQKLSPARSLAADGRKHVAQARDPIELPAESHADSPAAQEREVAPVERSMVLNEMRSSAAGLWLVIPSLIRMGFREWLLERPALLAADPGRVLIRQIARRHRVEGDDPVLAAFADSPVEPPPAWARLWRTGLDRWLRRRARLPLARLVWRAGWLRLEEERLVVRFPPAAADLRLRRHALDVDPGWTDWLGLSVRYLYAERPAA